MDRVDSDRVCKPYQSFKSALYENRFELYHSKRLEDEITELERNINTGKVDHPPNGHKDVCDAVCGSMFTCSKYADEYGYDYGETYKAITSFNMADKNVTLESINQSFEDEIKSMFTREILTDNDYKRMGMMPPEKASSHFSDRIIMI